MLIEIRNHLKTGEGVELLLPDKTVEIKTRTVVDDHGNRIDQAHAGNHIRLPFPFPAPKGALLRKAIKKENRLLG
jgi:hypothetical protein